MEEFDKSVAATPYKLQQARRRGSVARSPDLTGAVALLTAAATLYAWSWDALQSLMALARASLVEGLSMEVTAPSVVSLTRGAVGSGEKTLTSTEMTALRGAGLSDAEIAQQIKLNGDIYLFRGTSEGFPGNPVLQKLGISPASTDPLVATVFGLESKAVGGKPVLVFGARGNFSSEIDLGNIRSVLEREVQVNMVPAEFYRAAPNKMSVDSASKILRDMKIVDLPPLIKSSSDATKILETTPRLTPLQIQEFLDRSRQTK